ncbi:ferritin-like protein [Streptomyces sp. NBC_00882]|uniref:ferritin-like domain-containing protein n=1 Tax=Streptomyces TaxID=1883 RepID=UPI00386E3395|nr:ferritin-like protein [Streptomyces sp. NBC_00882]WSZ55262.1 ferritin-like protein [Streptomyces canus]
MAPFKRRTFLATAAVTAGVSVTATAAPASAAGPHNGPADPWPLDSVERLLAMPEAGRDIDWLRSALQVAVALELSTIPPYLCGWWSIRDRGTDAARLIRRVIDDEMYHLGVVCNLLVAVGGRPQIRAAAPTYPGPLPGGVHAGVTVYLSGLTRSFVHDVMMAIEAPEEPLALSDSAPPTIGAFYGAVLQGFRTVAPQLSASGQLSAHIGSDELRPVETLLDAERSIDIIREQGEGTSSSPADSFADDHPAHYYAFGEIYHGRQLRQTDTGWTFTGAPVPFPDARPMAPVPAGGWDRPPAPVQQFLDRFDTTYTTLLDSLDAAWGDGGPRSLGTAIHAMRALEEPAVRLMETEIPGTHSTYGPQFHALP